MRRSVFWTVIVSIVTIGVVLLVASQMDGRSDQVVVLPSPTPLVTTMSSPLVIQSPVPSPTPAVLTEVNIYLVALEDQGRNGQRIGCGDSLIPLRQTVEPTTAPLSAAINRLLSIREQSLGQSGLYNPLYQSNLRLESARVEHGVATVNLSGNLRLGGVCDNPRVQEQLEATIRQFPTVRETRIFINGTPLSEVLSQRGS